MRHGPAGSVCLVLTLLVSATAAVSAQTRAAPNAKPPRPSTTPRTSDGHADLQGIWLNNDATPLERPAALANKPFLSDQEVAELRTRFARLFKSGVDSDFAPGDNAFLAALANPAIFKNVNATGGADDMVERLFDNRTSLITDPPDGRIPYTAEGRQKRLAFDASAFLAPRSGPPAGPEDLSTHIRCITYGTPRLGGPSASYKSYYQIVQTPGYVMLLTEAFHDARIIPLDGRAHLPPALRQWSGDARGRWQGDTLIVETSNFSRNLHLLGSAEHLQIVERFTRTSTDQIAYEMTFTDPTVFSRPWTAVVHLHQTSAQIFEDACHEGNETVMSGILAGAREEEKASGSKQSR